MDNSNQNTSNNPFTPVQTWPVVDNSPTPPIQPVAQPSVVPDGNTQTTPTPIPTWPLPNSMQEQPTAIPQTQPELSTPQQLPVNPPAPFDPFASNSVSMVETTNQSPLSDSLPPQQSVTPDVISQPLPTTEPIQNTVTANLYSPSPVQDNTPVNTVPTETAPFNQAAPSSFAEAVATPPNPIQAVAPDLTLNQSPITQEANSQPDVPATDTVQAIPSQTQENPAPVSSFDQTNSTPTFNTPAINVTPLADNSISPISVTTNEQPQNPSPFVNPVSSWPQENYLQQTTLPVDSQTPQIQTQPIPTPDTSATNPSTSQSNPFLPPSTPLPTDNQTAPDQNPFAQTNSFTPNPTQSQDNFNQINQSLPQGINSYSNPEPITTPVASDPMTTNPIVNTQVDAFQQTSSPVANTSNQVSTDGFQNNPFSYTPAPSAINPFDSTALPTDQNLTPFPTPQLPANPPIPQQEFNITNIPTDNAVQPTAEPVNSIPDVTSTPVDFSQLTPITQTGSGMDDVYNPALQQTDTSVLPTTPNPVPALIASTETHSNNLFKPVALAGVFVGIIAVIVSAYFVLGLGKSGDVLPAASLPVQEQAPLTNPPKQINRADSGPTNASAATPEASPTSSTSPSPSSSTKPSAIDQLKNRATPTPKP